MDCNMPDGESSLVITDGDSMSKIPDDAAMATSDPKKKKKKVKKLKRSQKAKDRLVRPLPKAVTSKDALMVLKELKGVIIDNMQIKQDHEGKNVANIVVNSKKYDAEGSSENSAGNAACEKALREILTTKMKALLAEPENSSGGDEDNILEKMTSYAVYKLAEKWNSDAIDVAALYNDVKNKKTSSSVGQLPKLWKNMHPCMVLMQMRPQTTFKFLGSSGENRKVFSMGVSVDNCEFKADGPTKKDARRKVAALVCNKLFGTDYPQA